VHDGPRALSWHSTASTLDTDTDTDTDTDFLADIFARIVARMSACRSACHWNNNFRKSCVGRVDEDPREDVHVGATVSVSASWNSSFRETTNGTCSIILPEQDVQCSLMLNLDLNEKNMVHRPLLREYVLIFHVTVPSLDFSNLFKMINRIITIFAQIVCVSWHIFICNYCVQLLHATRCNDCRLQSLQRVACNNCT